MRIITPGTLATMAALLADNLTETITLKRGGTTLDAQPCMVRKVGQVQYTEGEYVSTGSATVEVIGGTSLDIEQEDRFAWDGKNWTVVEAPVVGTNHVSRKAIAKVAP